MSAALSSRVERRVREIVEQMVLSEAASLGGARASLEALSRRLEQLEAREVGLRTELDQGLALVRFTPATTVGRALALHPGVAALLAERGLDRCEGCPVRHDETLAELARGHDIPLVQLLSTLEALPAMRG
jgi:hypothetical protein